MALLKHMTTAAKDTRKEAVFHQVMGMKVGLEARDEDGGAVSHERRPMAPWEA